MIQYLTHGIIALAFATTMGAGHAIAEQLAADTAAKASAQADLRVEPSERPVLSTGIFGNPFSIEGWEATLSDDVLISRKEPFNVAGIPFNVRDVPVWKWGKRFGGLFLAVPIIHYFVYGTSDQHSEHNH